MTKLTMTAVVILLLASASSGQSSLQIEVKGHQKWSARQVNKVYLSACSAVQREFGVARQLRPKLTLILGANKDQAFMQTREVQLVKWDPYLFAEGVVLFAFDDLMSVDERLAVAKRAVNWANSTIDIDEISK